MRPHPTDGSLVDSPTVGSTVSVSTVSGSRVSSSNRYPTFRSSTAVANGAFTIDRTHATMKKDRTIVATNGNVPTRSTISTSIETGTGTTTTTTTTTPSPRERTVHSSNSTAFPERWGPCDPRTIESYVPQGRVWFVSFAGWSEKRQTNIRKVVEQNFWPGWWHGRVRPLLFTEDDLPQSYYNEFNWSFTEREYKGFWTWKPWILRNLTETGVFEVGDVVVWMDSDRKLLASNGNNNTNMTYFKTAVCNMEHRNDNYAGVFPFRRCSGNLESRNTKPETFARMGLDRTVFGTLEQIYAGMIGFHIHRDTTLGFLKEWEQWGRVPVMYGDDTNFPSHPPPPRIYRRHKNDQSVFSLMVRSRGMKAWPAPYYDPRRSGINKACHANFEDAGYCFFIDNHPLIPNVCKPFEEWLETL